MAEKNAIFGLFAGGNAGKVFKELGITAQKTSKDTSSLAMVVEKASIRMESASKKELDAQGKVKLAQIELNRVRASGVPQEKELTVAEERLATAQRASVLATTENSRATKALAASEIEANAAATHLHKGFLGLSSSTVPLGHRLKSTTKLIGGMALGFGAFKAFQFGKQSLTAAEEFQASQTKLQVAIKNTGHSFASFQKPVDDLNAHFRKLGFTDAETQDALATLTVGLKDPTKAMGLMAISADLARARNMGFAESALLITKAQHGQLRGTKALGIDTGVAASGLLQIKKATEAHAKAVAHYNDLLGKSSGVQVTHTRHTGNAAKAQARLNVMLYKWNEPAQRTISQSNQIARAQDAVAKANDTSSTSMIKGRVSADALAKAHQAIIDTQTKMNDATAAGATQVEAINKALGGTAEKQAQKDFAIRQKALNSELDHIKVSAGENALPALMSLTNWMIKDGIPALGKFGKAFKSVQGYAGGLGSTIGKLGDSLSSIFGGTNGDKAAADATKQFPGLAGHPGAALAASRTAAVKQFPGLKGNPDAAKIAATVNSARALSSWESSMRGADKASQGKPLTSSHAPTIHVTNHIYGHVLTEKKLVDVVHAGITQKVIRSGGNLKVLGARGN
jgi:hypothetical protein